MTLTATTHDKPKAPFLKAHLHPPEDLVIVGLDTGDTEEHPLYDPRALLPVDEALVASMTHEGFNFGAIEVSMVGHQLLVVDGRRRVKAAREANKRLVARGKEPIRVRTFVESGSKADLFGIMVAANAFRLDLGPLEKAELVQRYLGYGRSPKEAARRFGVTDETIRCLRKLLKLDDSIKDAIRAGKISANKAMQLVDLDPEEQLEAMNEALEGGDSAEEIKAKVKRKKGKKANARPGIREIREVLENERLTKTAEHALRWVLGEEDSVQPA